ncbi:enoyl-CoA hydratase-related protein [Robbsia andropogonis]|uniref:enoyl-CoA hydratase-related protein n=1 Tax=Robbsia andropogonis TaxID=28092 RepID=UPI000463870F|nr:enoyl-CoA hydratase-related protein [Robbsia andropogonis]MCP1117068.1 enoyl-CoA hydratase-related protein [Robbsia andropogonis]MCP1128415.1 enoyl-CoA hydratase-related protein [Robbsia andropogonis]
MTTGEEGIRVESDAASAGAVRVLRWHRPAKRNAINLAMYRAMATALREAEADETVKVVVVAGSEHDGTAAFTAGNDLSDFAARGPSNGPDAHHAVTAADASDITVGLQPVLAFLDTLNRMRKPLLAAVRGPAVGIGTTMLLHCDIVCAGDDARFALPFTALGLCPEAGASLLLPRLVGYQRAARLLLLGEPFDSAQALAYGVVSEVLPADTVESHVLALARKLAMLPREAVQATKALMKPRESDAPAGVASTARQITIEADVFARLLQTPAAQERILAASGGKARRA